MEEYFGFARELLESGQAEPGAVYGMDSLYDYLVQFRDDIAFYVDTAQRVQGPVLDLGCGTGRVLLALAQAGITCEGMDISQPMLNLAAEKLQAHGYSPALHHGDMTGFSVPRRYGAILIPYQSMMYMLDDTMRRQVLTTAYRHLQPGGLLAFDFDCSHRETGDHAPYLALQGIHPFKQHIMLQVVQMRVYEGGRRLLNQINYELTEPVVITVQRSLEASCPVQEMTALVREAGYCIEGVYQDFAQTPYESGPECVIRAVKPRADNREGQPCAEQP